MTRREQAALFDRLASGGTLYFYDERSLRLLDGLVPEKGRVLDVGCGDGAIGASFDAAVVVAFDISPRCAALARTRGLAALAADATVSWPFRSGCFDTVYVVDMLHHVPGCWEGVLAQADRVLRPGGTLVLVEPDANNRFVRWTQAPRSPLRVAPCANEPAIYPADLVRQVRRLGYEAEDRPIHIEGRQAQRAVFAWWQRLLKAPFVLALAFWYRQQPNKFAVVARKPGPVEA